MRAAAVNLEFQGGARHVSFNSSNGTSRRVVEERSIRQMKIGLLDHMGYGNLGDAATQDAVITNINLRLPGVQIIAFSLVPQDTTKRHGIPCHPIRRWVQTPEEKTHEVRDAVNLGSRLKTVLKRSRALYASAKPFSEFAHEALFWIRSYRILSTIDLVIISGGGQLDDLWPSQPYTLFVFALLTRLAGKKLYLLNVGVGNLTRTLDKIFAKWVVWLAHYRSVRDLDSQQRLTQFGVGAHTHVYPDLVYSLEVEELREQKRILSKPTVGLNPAGFCDPRIWPRKNERIYRHYIEKLFNFSVWLLDRGYDVRLFSTDFGVDKYALADLKARLCSRLTPTEIFRAPSEGVRDVLNEMAECDFIVTSKFHGIVFSHLLGKPVISLNYHRKMDTLMEDAGQAAFCADIEQFDAAWLKETFSSLVDQSSGIKRQYATAVRINANKLSQQFDDLFMFRNAGAPTCFRDTRIEGFEKCGRYSEARTRE